MNTRALEKSLNHLKIQRSFESGKDAKCYEDIVYVVTTAPSITKHNLRALQLGRGVADGNLKTACKSR
jgi:hypothetical protein